MTDQNKFLLKQNIFIVIILLLTWVIGYWYNNYEYFPLWLFGLFFMLIVGPIIGLCYYRIYRKLPTRRLNLTFRASLWLGIAILAIPNLIYVVVDNVYWVNMPELSYLSNLWWSIKRLISFTFLVGVLSTLIKSWPYWVTIGLLYWSIRVNKKLSKNL
jgi:hypothetical protein